jgi:uncharacterized protein
VAEKMNPVNWFEIPVRDLNRAQTFYEDVFGVRLTRNDMGPMHMAWFPMSQDAPGATGSLVQAEDYEPSLKGSTVYFTVESIETTLARAEEQGGTVLNPKTSIGEYGYIAHVRDPEGNRIALHSQH